MKKIIFIFLITSSLITGINAQTKTTDTSLHTAAIAVCDCLSKSSITESNSQEVMQQAFLSCMLTSAPDLITQIVSSGEDFQKAGEEIGTRLAMEMMKNGCPSFTKFATAMAINGSSDTDVNMQAPAAPTQSADGVVTKVEEKDFLYITLKTTAGRELTFIYYNFVPGSDDWVKNPVNKLKNKNVFVSYNESEVYQPKFKEFMNVREIKTLTIK